jgi:hypothetical protein
MESVHTEWEAVRNVKSLFAHYGSQRLYQRWRHRFLQAGYLKTRGKTRNTLAYNRSYYAHWRRTHRERVKQYTEDYWRRKLARVQTATN